MVVEVDLVTDTMRFYCVDICVLMVHNPDEQYWSLWNSFFAAVCSIATYSVDSLQLTNRSSYLNVCLAVRGYFVLLSLCLFGF